MADDILLEVITPEGVVVSEKVEEVRAPGALGEFGVLPGHDIFLTTLKIGILKYRQKKEFKYLVVNTGFVEVGPSRFTALVKTAEFAFQIDFERAKAAQERAQQRLKDRGREDLDFARAEAALQRALARITVSQEKG